MIRLIDFNKMIPSRQLHSVKPLGVVKNYRKLWLVVDQQKHGRKPRTGGIEISSLMRLSEEMPKPRLTLSPALVNHMPSLECSRDTFKGE